MEHENRFCDILWCSTGNPKKLVKSLQNSFNSTDLETATATKLVYDLMTKNITLLPISPVEKWKTELQMEIS